jgi:hypothetical protein
MRNIVGGVSNIPKRYPTIINAHAKKKKRLKDGKVERDDPLK